MSMLAELVEVVIGVDTHNDTHTAAVLDARTGGVLARATVSADPDGYAELSILVEQHSGLRAWAMEGTGGNGAITLSRLRYDQRTRDYADRRRAEGKTDREIKRCLKRYIARELYRRLETPPSPA